eukprot:CAMPEP_0198668836 /NCGR_PEP_ID=MMETSP1467-20131203/73848_1 /TAXON_ID=1462469 /ORGANISM="unid. sp., Strain CCMP2135" /LENGTH=315 /DNA_ID=CAMNT_0044405569 /DNA_START=25 /DNA_END=972 /DNA_ORIENTATION=-
MTEEEDCATSPSPQKSWCPWGNLRVSTSPQTRDHDWDAEARELLRCVNLDDRSKTKYRNADAVYSDPTTGARLFIGNVNAARSESFLVGERIFHIVNCQDESSTNFFEGDERFHYKRFPVSQWVRQPQNVASPEGVLRFFERGCHAWIEAALARGHNVLVHCLAGAHRAGTTGVSYVMRAAHFDVATAVNLAKFQRPVVDPFGQLLELLYRLEAAYLRQGVQLVVAASVPPAFPRSGSSRLRAAASRTHKAVSDDGLQASDDVNKAAAIVKSDDATTDKMTSASANTNDKPATNNTKPVDNPLHAAPQRDDNLAT